MVISKENSYPFNAGKLCFESIHIFTSVQINFRVEWAYTVAPINTVVKVSSTSVSVKEISIKISCKVMQDISKSLNIFIHK